MKINPNDPCCNMTIRDWFAGQAMIGNILVNAQVAAMRAVELAHGAETIPQDDMRNTAKCADNCYLYADALIDRANREEGSDRHETGNAVTGGGCIYRNGDRWCWPKTVDAEHNVVTYCGDALLATDTTDSWGTATCNKCRAAADREEGKPQ